jgi:hypothetical protein
MNYEEIFKHAAQALANFEIPDFDKFSEDDVFNAFSEVRWWSSDFDEWASFMQEEVNKASNGQTKLINTSFYTGIRGPNRQFILNNGDRERKVVAGPYMPPIMFWG